jgi:OmcA/MtrC family decaheme c-type cytochrome
MTLLAASNLLVPAHSTETVLRRLHTGTPTKTYAATETEHYLTAQQIEYVRPGLNVTVNSVQIGTDNIPVVDLTFADDSGQPLDRAGVLTPGPVSMSFILAWYDPVGRYYTDYSTRIETDPKTGNKATQAATDPSGGTWEDLAIGHARYHFKTILPSGYDVTKTHTLGIYATRAINLTDPLVISKTYYSNALFDFRPDGQPVSATWGKIATAACNQCHDPLATHGGSRREVKLCVLCHNPQTTDAETGNTVDMKVFIHKIHMGSSLPSVQEGHPYQIIGYQQSVNDYSTVVFPQPINNCASCHTADAPQASVWYTYPSRAACGSCHDNINWATGDDHAATGPQLDDSACANCHPPQGLLEYDASIQGAHTVVYKSKQLHGLTMQVLSVTQAAPGQKPIVTFKLTDKNGVSIDPRPIDTCRFTIGGPTTDYSTYFSENALPTVTFDGAVSTYAFKGAIPANATGTWVLTCDVEWTTIVQRGDDKPDITDFTESPANPIVYLAMTDPQPVPRRQVVDIAKCNVCHDRVAAHGGQRLLTQECVVCHNPVDDDSSQRPAAAGQPESISFQRMIHRIHSGENLTQEYSVYGHGGTKVAFNDVRFPGDRRDCIKCHVAGTYAVPDNPPDGLLSTITLRDYYSPQGPTAAACLGCHDTKSAAAHAFQATATFGEACAACHANDAQFSADMVHAH